MQGESESEVAQSCPTLSDPMDCSQQAPPSMGFSRQEYWSGVPLPSPCKGKGSVKIRTKISAETEIQKYINYIVCVKVYEAIIIVFITRGVSLEMFMAVEIFILHIDCRNITYLLFSHFHYPLPTCFHCNTKLYFHVCIFWFASRE